MGHGHDRRLHARNAEHGDRIDEPLGLMTQALRSGGGAVLHIHMPLRTAPDTQMDSALSSVP